MSITNSELSIIMDILKDINQKLSDVMPRVTIIESRLDKLDCLDSLLEIKSSTSDILAEVRGCSSSVVSLPDRVRRDIEDSDSLSQVSYKTDQGFQSERAAELEEAQAGMTTRYGLVMSDSDMTELATKTGQLLNCEVEMFNYRQEQLEPDLFSKELEFVLIQDSGQMLEQCSELTKATVQDMTAHVQQLVKLSSNILELQPGTKVLLGSLPPRYDGRLRAEQVRVFNSLLLTESFLEDRISVVSQSQLSCRFEKKKVERFEADLVTLTRYGKKLRDKNIAVQIEQAVPNIKIVKKTPDHQYKRRYACSGDNQNLKEMLADILHSL